MNSRTNAPSSGKGSMIGPVAAPKDVRTSFVLWLTAVGAGVTETVIRVIFTMTGDPERNGLLLRVIVYAVAVYVAWQMRHGKGWARITLAVLLVGIGTLSLVVDPISWLAEGHSLEDFFAQANLLFVLIAPIRAVHLAAVISAFVLMFRPISNDYFRTARSARRRTA